MWLFWLRESGSLLSSLSCLRPALAAAVCCLGRAFDDLGQVFDIVGKPLTIGLMRIACRGFGWGIRVRDIATHAHTRTHARTHTRACWLFCSTNRIEAPSGRIHCWLHNEYQLFTEYCVCGQKLIHKYIQSSRILYDYRNHTWNIWQTDVISVLNDIGVLVTYVNQISVVCLSVRLYVCDSVIQDMGYRDFVISYSILHLDANISRNEELQKVSDPELCPQSYNVSVYLLLLCTKCWVHFCRVGNRLFCACVLARHGEHTLLYSLWYDVDSFSSSFEGGGPVGSVLR